MEDIIYEEFDVVEISNNNGICCLNNVNKKVISEISLKIIVNEVELVSLLCLNQCQEELAIGFLYNEGVINDYNDVVNIYYNEKMFAVIVTLREGLVVDRQESLRSITSGCGKCYTYINPLKNKQYISVKSSKIYSVQKILNIMKGFLKQSEIFKNIGGVHSVLFYNEGYQILNEDIGRHNCFDKITGILFKNRQLELSDASLLFVSGRISSEIITKIVRMGVPVVVSRSTPTAAAVKLANQYNITLLGYVRDDRGYIYASPDRLF